MTVPYKPQASSPLCAVVLPYLLAPQVVSRYTHPAILSCPVRPSPMSPRALHSCPSIAVAPSFLSSCPALCPLPRKHVSPPVSPRNPRHPPCTLPLSQSAATARAPLHTPRHTPLVILLGWSNVRRVSANRTVRNRCRLSPPGATNPMHALSSPPVQKAPLSFRSRRSTKSPVGPPL